METKNKKLYIVLGLGVCIGIIYFALDSQFSVPYFLRTGKILRNVKPPAFQALDQTSDIAPTAEMPNPPIENLQRTDFLPNMPDGFAENLPLEQTPAEVVSSFREIARSDIQQVTRIVYAYASEKQVQQIGNEFEYFFSNLGYVVQKDYDPKLDLLFLSTDERSGMAFHVMVAKYYKSAQQYLVTVVQSSAEPNKK